jgi:hypothetical protein
MPEADMDVVQEGAAYAAVDTQASITTMEANMHWIHFMPRNLTVAVRKCYP